RDGDLLRVPTAGGEALLIAENAAQGPGATWGPRGSIVYSTAWLGGLAEMPADGGAARQLTTPDAAQGERGHWWPQFLPGGRAVLFTVWRAGSGLNDARLAVLDLDSGRYRTLLPGSNAFYLRSGHLVYYRAGIHYAVPFDADSLEVRGEPVRVLDEVRELAPQGTRDTSLALSPAGTLAFVTGHLMPESTFVWATADGEVEALPLPPRSYQDLRLSPDGRRAGVATLEAGRYVVRLVDLERGVEQALQMTGSNWDLAWHPDGERLAFSSMRKGDFDVYWRDLAAGTPEEPLLDSETDEWPEDFSPDGSRLVYAESMPDGQYEVRALELGGGKPQTLFPEQENVAVSPDGRWLAYGEGQTSVRPFGRPGAAVQVSRRGGGAPVWSRTEPLLLYRRGSEIVASSYREEQGRFLVGEERVLVDVPGLRRYGRTFDLAPDGRILALVGDYPAAEIHVALGWDREVARLLDGAAAR
ncbi:MAG TPA: hypothetical protein VMT16_07570, partial [Thermoanaerobaculia bacterium]|nr:hypothetical protein [Thermoanaerobaculia bacterium]